MLGDSPKDRGTMRAQGPGAKHEVEILSETFGLMVRSCIKACRASQF